LAITAPRPKNIRAELRISNHELIGDELSKLIEDTLFPQIPHGFYMGITHRSDLEQPAVLPFLNILLHLRKNV